MVILKITIYRVNDKITPLMSHGQERNDYSLVPRYQPPKLKSPIAPSPRSLKINPGCLHEGLTLSDYKPVDTELTYHHPSVVQYAKLSRSGKPVSFRFRDYMAIMSAYKFIQPEKIIIHTYGDIKGKYWGLMQKWNNNANTRIEVNKVQRVSKLGGKKVKFVEHEADYIKLQGLLKFGGVIIDSDVIMLNGTKLKQLQLISECVLAQEAEVVNIGFISCIKNSSFIRKWRNSYHTDFHPDSKDWTYNSANVPTDILLHGKVCYNMYLDYSICNNPGWAQAPKKWLKHNGVVWRSKTAAHYFTKRNFLYDDERLLDKDDSFGEMLRYVNNA